MTKQSKTTELTISSPIVDVLSILKTELNNLKKITESSYKTDGKVEGFSSNIQTETNEAMLIKMYASALDRKRMYEEGAKDLGIDSYPVYTINGNSLDSIKHDILLKIAVLKHDARKKELEALVKETEELMDREDRLKLLQNKIAKTIGQ